MTKYLIILFAMWLALPMVSASAQEEHAKDVPCVGPMCMLTPIWKLGTMLPEMTAPKQPSTAPMPMAESNTDQNAKSSPTLALQNESSAAKIGRQTDVGKTNGNGQPTSVTSDTGQSVGSKSEHHETARRTTTRSVHQFTYRLAHRFAVQPAAASRGASAQSGKANIGVTVAANGTEFDRLLRLASVVTKPSIKVVPAVSFVDGCRLKPADFVVDTMSNPERVGPAIPLFTESLVIIARKDVKDLASLRGRQVSFGLLSSSSHRVADRVFRSLAVDVREQPLDLENALDALSLGDLDAVALLAPKGFYRLAHHDPSFHLLTLPDQFRPPEGLKLSRIEPSSYLGGGWSASHLSVVSVDAVLSPNRIAQMPLSAQSVYAALDQHSSQLAANGFDLIGGNGGVMTMRSSAKDPLPATQRAEGADCDN